jgi:catechol 2,3-dioxygenase-like lactoylglutathione lyase family enzyme
VSQPPEITFLSLFVPDLKEAARCYQEVLGLEPVPNQGQAPDPHPFAGSAPVLFELGQVRIALYEANPNRGTHAGDVGIGVRFHQGLAAVAERAKHNRATTHYRTATSSKSSIVERAPRACAPGYSSRFNVIPVRWSSSRKTVLSFDLT